MQQRAHRALPDHQGFVNYWKAHMPYRQWRLCSSGQYLQLLEPVIASLITVLVSHMFSRLAKSLTICWLAYNPSVHM